MVPIVQWGDVVKNNHNKIKYEHQREKHKCSTLIQIFLQRTFLLSQMNYPKGIPMGQSVVPSLLKHTKCFWDQLSLVELYVF